MANKNNSNSKNGSNVGAGLVAVGAALAAGYYFYASDNAKKHRKMVATWATNLKDDVLEKAETLKDNLNKESLLGVIDEVADTYYTAKNISKEDLGRAVEELKQNWSKVVEELKKDRKSIKTKASKTKNKIPKQK